jgi:PAS domain S-box-containing protein
MSGVMMTEQIWFPDVQTQVLDAVEQAVIVTDIHGHIRYWNPCAERLYGWAADEVLGRNIVEVTPARLSQAGATALMRQLQQGEAWSGEFLVQRRDGSTFWAHVTDAPLRDTAGQLTGIVGLSTDITARKQAEQERTELLAREQAARAEAEAALGLRDEFLAIAAHELKTPVTSLRGYAQLLLRHLGAGTGVDPTRLQRAVAAIDQQSEKLTRFIDQLLDVSQLAAGRLVLQREVTNVGTLIVETVALLQQTTAQHTLRAVVAADTVALVDPLRLEQVLTNLIGNATKFSPLGGTVTVELESPEAGMLCITVADEGIGIPSEHRAQIFDRFFQAPGAEVRGGIGLGLAISRQIVQQHGGHLAAEFPEGGGTRMVITLPLMDAGATDDQAAR